MQKLLFDKYSSKLFTVCRRYTRDDLEAEDVMQEAFVLVFKKLDTFEFKGSLQNWMRTIMVNVALRKLQKKSRRDTSYNLEQIEEPSYEEDFIASMSADEIIKHVQRLPDGYRNVFNLYVIEGYKHNEIGELLNIGESTSRSQLTKARRMLQKSLEGLKYMLI
jgi:RNA polymerase sigma-70 factor (ECF subfamily)